MSRAVIVPLLASCVLVLVSMVPAFGADAPAEDADLDGIFDSSPLISSPAVAPSPAKGTCPLVMSWESPPSPQNLLQVATGDPDGDGRASIIVPYYLAPKATLSDFENTGDNSFSPVWSHKPRGKGIYGSVALADLDGDGRGEIVAGSYSHEVRIFESDGDDSYVEHPALPSLGGDASFHDFIMRDVEIADTNGDGREDIVVVQSGSSFPSWGTVSIFSGDGRLLYSWFANTYLRSVGSGYFDDDEHLDIFISHGGFGLESFYVDWIEHTGMGYYRRTIDLPGTGLPMAVDVADINDDGRSELLVAGIYDQLRQLLVLVPDGDNMARISQQVEYPSSTSPMDMDVGYVWDGGYPEIAVATHSSGGLEQVFFFRYDGSKVSPVCHTGSEFADGIYSFNTIDLTFADGDGRADIVLTVGGIKALVLETLEEVVTAIPDVRINGSDGDLRMQRGDPVTVSVSLSSKAVTNASQEIWLAAARKRPKPALLFSFRHPSGWLPGLEPALTGKLAEFGPLKVLETKSLQPGYYTIYFGTDMTPNGRIDAKSLALDKVSFEIIP